MTLVHNGQSVPKTITPDRNAAMMNRVRLIHIHYIGLHLPVAL